MFYSYLDFSYCQNERQLNKHVHNKVLRANDHIGNDVGMGVGKTPGRENKEGADSGRITVA